MKRVVRAAAENDVFYWNGVDDVPEDVVNVVVEEGVNRIEYVFGRHVCFSRCKYLKTIKLPQSLKYIGDRAFTGCYSLESIELPSSLAYIGVHAFSGCHSLVEIDIPDNVSTIGEFAFDSCTSLKYVHLPFNLHRIEKFTFGSCKSLESIDIPDSVVYIGTDAFALCSNLEYVNIENPNCKIRPSSFSYCDKLNKDSLNAKITRTNPPNKNRNDLGEFSDRFIISEDTPILPDVDGYEFVCWVRSRPEYEDIFGWGEEPEFLEAPFYFNPRNGKRALGVVSRNKVHHLADIDEVEITFDRLNDLLRKYGKYDIDEFPYRYDED